MMRWLVCLSLLALGCVTEEKQSTPSSEVEIVVLGIAQDAGYPQAACQKACCQLHWEGDEPARKVVSLGLTDHRSGQQWMFEATPDFPAQWESLRRRGDNQPQPDGIFLTHAHIGHYTGLMYLGREVMGADQVPVMALPRMTGFLNMHGPWSQLLRLGNVRIDSLEENQAKKLGADLSVTPWVVPHRDEFSETAGFLIEGPEKSILFLPDIDKWEKWDKDLMEILKTVDVALIDATFFRNGELPNRDMSEIPHPFVEETMTLLQDLPEEERQKVCFIHFNHTNPLIWDPTAKQEVKNAGFRVAKEGMVFGL